MKTPASNQPFAVWIESRASFCPCLTKVCRPVAAGLMDLSVLPTRCTSEIADVSSRLRVVSEFGKRSTYPMRISAESVECVEPRQGPLLQGVTQEMKLGHGRIGFPKHRDHCRGQPPASQRSKSERLEVSVLGRPSLTPFLILSNLIRTEKTTIRAR